MYNYEVTTANNVNIRDRYPFIVIDNYVSESDMDMYWDDSNTSFYLQLSDSSTTNTFEYYGDLSFSTTNIMASSNISGYAYTVSDSSRSNPLFKITLCDSNYLSFYNTVSQNYIVNGCNL